MRKRRIIKTPESKKLDVAAAAEKPVAVEVPAPAPPPPKPEPLRHYLDDLPMRRVDANSRLHIRTSQFPMQSIVADREARQHHL